MFCAKCGAEIKEGSKFCGKCGASVEEIKALESDAAKLQNNIGLGAGVQSASIGQSNGNKLPIVLLGTAVLFMAVAVGVGGFFLFRGRNASGPADADVAENADAVFNRNIEGDGDEYPVHIDVYSAVDVRTGEDGSLLRDLLTGARASLRAGADAYKGEVLQTLEADADGRINTTLPAGIYTAQIDVEGYTPAYVTVEVAEQETVAEGYMLPVPETDQAGIILTWEGEADLDLILLTPYQSTDGDMAHIGGSIMNDRYGNRLVADNAAGCEVMYVNTAVQGDYKLYVNNYTESEAGNYSSGQLSTLNVHIYIYDSTGLVAEYRFPEEQIGVVWEAAALNGSQVTPGQRVYSSPEGEGWWTENKWALDLEKNQKLQRLLNNMAQTAWWNNDILLIGDNGTTYSDTAKGMQKWADGLYQGNWEELGDLVSAVSFWQDVPYVTEPNDMPEGGQYPSEDPKYGVSLTKEQMEYLAYAAVGTEWKMQNMDEILDSTAAYGSMIEYHNDMIRIIDTSYDSYVWLELEIADTVYTGGGNWKITMDGIYFNQHAPELSNIKFADITFSVTRNSNSCFDGYSVTGMSVTPTDNSGWAQAYLDKMSEEAQDVEEWNNSHEPSTGCLWEYDLIYLNDDDIPELVSGPDGYWVSVYTWHNGQLYTIIDAWGYGAGGNFGYEYIPRTGIVSNSNADMAGLIYYNTYWKIDESYALETILSIMQENYRDLNGNNMPDEGEDLLDEGIEYVWDDASKSYRQISDEESRATYDAWGISGKEWEFIEGKYSPYDMRYALETISK